MKAFQALVLCFLIGLAQAQVPYSVQLDDNGLLVGIQTGDSIYLQSSTMPWISYPNMVSVYSLVAYENLLLTNLSLPALKAHVGPINFNLSIVENGALQTVDLNALVSSSSTIAITHNPALTNLLLGNLVFVRSYLSLHHNDALVTLNLPELVSVATFPFNGLSASLCPNLANVSLPKYLPSKGRPQSFDGCALTQATVDHILARCVASVGYTSGTVDLSGGTSAPPSAAGAADKATLIARGCTVLTN